MKTPKFATLFVSVFLFNSTVFAGWHNRILDVRSGIELSRQEFISLIADYPLIVMGELHYTKGVQEGEGSLITDVVSQHKHSKRVALAWEFLNAKDQAKTDQHYASFLSGKINAQDFLKAAQSGKGSEAYTPMVEATKAAGGWIYGVNLSREDKAPVSSGGLKNAKPGTIPDGFEMGGADYFDRFYEAMGGHGPKDKLQNYYEAQCLTDDVMAVNLLKLNAEQVFFVVGSFHTDYFDGTYRRIKRRNDGLPMVTIRFIDASDSTEEELLETANHPKYGAISDFVIFVNEPKAP